MKLEHINKIVLILVHIILTLFLIYLALNIIHRNSILPNIGYVLISMIIFIIVFHIYDLLYKKSLNKKIEEKPETSHGILTRKREDPGYDIIGGISGFG